MAYQRRFLPELESVRTHKVPNWYHEDKLGIFIHWGLYSVPAFAPPVAELGEIEPDINWYGNNPYAEWYWNSVRVGQGPTYEHHIKTYGKDFNYNDFTKEFHAEKFDASSWMKLFKKAGAKYVVPVTKHHDGFCLWDSKYTDFNSVKMGPKRDIISELNHAAKKEGIRLGLYYSGILDWQYCTLPIRDNQDLFNPTNITAEYADYAYNQVMELIDKYEPSVLWNDIGWPYKGEGDLPMLLSYYYNTVEDGVINDRWNNVWHDYTTKEYKQGSMDIENKWEMCRGLGLSFGYNQMEGEEKTISEKNLILLLVQTVSNNGNLLINVGPKADGTIPKIQEERLLSLGKWLEVNGEAIYGTDVWKRQEEALAYGLKSFYTTKQGKVYAIIDGVENTEQRIILPGHGKYEKAIPLSKDVKIKDAKEENGDYVITLDSIPSSKEIIAFELSC